MKRVAILVFLLCLLFTQAVFAAGKAETKHTGPGWFPSPPSPWSSSHFTPEAKGMARYQDWEKRSLVEAISRRITAEYGGDFPFIQNAGPDSFVVNANGPSGRLWMVVKLCEFVDPKLPWQTEMSFFGWGSGTGRKGYPVSQPGGSFYFNGFKPHNAPLQLNVFRRPYSGVPIGVPSGRTFSLPPVLGPPFFSNPLDAAPGVISYGDVPVPSPN